MKTYILVNDQIIEEPNLKNFYIWFTTTDRSIKKTKIGKFLISTVFLGYDHSFYDDENPILFETLVFSDDDRATEFNMIRYSKKSEAIEGHEKMCKIVESFLEKNNESQ